MECEIIPNINIIQNFSRDLINTLISEINFEDNYNENFQGDSNCTDTSKFFKNIIINNQYNFSMIKTKEQHGGALCGFFSLYNMLNFLQFLKNREHKSKQLFYLRKINSTSQFWLFYKETIKFLIESKYVSSSDKNSLLGLGPLERYQFKLLLETDTEIKQLISNGEKEEIKFFHYFYGFNFIQNMSKEEIKNLQIALEFFKNWKEEKRLIYVILLGVANHWSVLILENSKGEIKNYYLDSSNENIFKLVEEFYTNHNEDIGQGKVSFNSVENFKHDTELSYVVEKYVEERCKAIENFRMKPITPWFRKCYVQWIIDINSVVRDIFKILYENLSIYEIVMNSMIARLTRTFEEYNSCKLDNEYHCELELVTYSYSKEEIFFVKEKILQWLTVEYHPQILKVDVLNSFEAYSDFFSFKKLKEFKKFRNWIKFSNNIKKHIHVEDYLMRCDLEDKENVELISRYYDVIRKLESYL